MMYAASATNTVTLDKIAACLLLTQSVSEAASRWAIEGGSFHPPRRSIAPFPDIKEPSSSVKGFHLSFSPVHLWHEWLKTPAAYQPRTPLGRRLWEIRSRIIASGERLLSWDEIEEEIAERRGERGL